jgi:hypothetical protein
VLILSAFCYFAILAVSFATFLLSPCVVLAGHHQTLPLCGAAFPRMPSPASCGAFATFRFCYFSLFLQKSGSAVGGLIWSNIVGVVAGMVAFSGFRSITKINLAGV